MAGHIRILEMVFRREGAHPHLHLLLILDGEPTAMAGNELTLHWVETALRLGHDAKLAAQDVRSVAGAERDDVAAYLVKSDPRSRSRSSESLRAGDLLEGAVLGDADALERLLDYHHAVRGRRMVSISPTLLARDRAESGRDSG